MKSGSILIVEADDECARELQDGLKEGGLKNRVILKSSIAEAKHYLAGAIPGVGDPQKDSLAVILVGFAEDPAEDYEFIRWLRAKPEFYSLVVIALGRASRYTEISRAYESGANAYFIKGASLDPMLRTLKGIAELQSDTTFFTKPDEIPNPQSSNAKADFIGILTDNSETAKSIESVVRELGFANSFIRIGAVPEARDALAKSDHASAIVLLFVDLHVDQSQSFLAWVGNNPEWRPPSVVAVTSGHDMRLVMQAYHLGVNSFVKHPPRRDEIRNTLESLRGIRFSEENKQRFITRA